MKDLNQIVYFYTLQFHNNWTEDKSYKYIISKGFQTYDKEYL